MIAHSIQIVEVALVLIKRLEGIVPQIKTLNGEVNELLDLARAKEVSSLVGETL